MKKLSEFSMKEIKNLIVSLSAELKIIANDAELKKIFKAFADAKKGLQTEINNLDAVFAVVNSLLVTNENVLWNILSAITQSTSDEVQNMNNIQVVEVVTDFLSIEAYKKLFLQAFKSGAKE